MVDRLKKNATYEKDYRFGAGFPVDRAYEFIENIKSELVGKQINRVLVNDFWADYDQIKEDNRDYYETAKHFYREHPGRDCLIWDWIIIFEIGGEQFEISLWSPYRYNLGLNKIDIETVIETKGKKIKEFAQYMGNEKLYFDVSCIFEKDIINERIKDICITSKKMDDTDEEVLESIVILLENGKNIKISEDFDNVSVDIK